MRGKCFADGQAVLHWHRRRHRRLGQAGLWLLTNIVQTVAETVRVGMPVEVVFESYEGGVLPQFRPC